DHNSLPLNAQSDLSEQVEQRAKSKRLTVYFFFYQNIEIDDIQMANPVVK
ncbi:hypothetical protein ACJX0J_026375, partial [Zea mays]